MSFWPPRYFPVGYFSAGYWGAQENHSAGAIRATLAGTSSLSGTLEASESGALSASLSGSSSISATLTFTGNAESSGGGSIRYRAAATYVAHRNPNDEIVPLPLLAMSTAASRGTARVSEGVILSALASNKSDEFAEVLFAVSLSAESVGRSEASSSMHVNSRRALIHHQTLMMAA